MRQLDERQFRSLKLKRVGRYDWDALLSGKRFELVKNDDFSNEQTFRSSFALKAKRAGRHARVHKLYNENLAAWSVALVTCPVCSGSGMTSEGVQCFTCWRHGTVPEDTMKRRRPNTP